MGAVFYLNNKSNGSDTLTATVKSNDSGDAQYIYSLLSKMDKVNLDDSIFHTSVFQNLKDNTATFDAQVSGRNNPFAPLGTDGVLVQGTSSKK